MTRPKRIKFTKMQGLGNDFVVIEGESEELELTEDEVRVIADRRYGVGCDQLLYAGARRGSRFSYRIFNSDGSMAEQCGNGARCISRLLLGTHPELSEIVLESPAAEARAWLTDGGEVCVDMGKADLDPKTIPFQECSSTKRNPDGTFALFDEEGGFIADVLPVGMGNPHAVLFLPSIPSNWMEIGEKIGRHQAFPRGVNVEICSIIDGGVIEARIYERGAGATLACGSGACAAAAAAEVLKLISSRVKKIEMPGGVLSVEVGPDLAVRQIGAAEFVFEGSI